MIDERVLEARLRDIGLDLVCLKGTLVAVVNALRQTGNLDMNLLTANMKALRSIAENSNDTDFLEKVDKMLGGLEISVVAEGARSNPSLRLVPLEPDESTQNTDD